MTFMPIDLPVLAEPRRAIWPARAISTLVVIVVALLAGSCQTAPTAATDDWNAYAARSLEAYFEANPTVAVWAGRHEFDGRLPDWSAAGMQREIARLHAERERAARFPIERLDANQRFERELLLAKIDADLFWLESAQSPFRNPAYYGGMLDPNVYLARPYAPPAQRLRAYLTYAKAVPAAVAQIRANLRTPMPREFIRIGHITFGGLATFYESEVAAIFAAHPDNALQQDFRVANAEAIRAMRELDAWLTSLEPTATDDHALGAALYQQMLQATERVSTPIARLKAIGEADLQRNLAALREACAALAPGRSLQECVAQAHADKPRDSPVLAAQRQLGELRAFIVAHALVSIPGTEVAVTQEAPPYMRWNFAYIDIPGPFENHLPSTYYIAPPDPAWTPAEQAAYLPSSADLLFTSVHEVWPGHFLQFLHSNRAPSRSSRVYLSYAYTEGWAHYAEELMWEAGLGDGDPRAHIGQLLLALLRDVRFVSAIGMHTEGMTVAASEQMFRELAFQDPGNARQQAARGTFDPGYGNYTLGKLMIRQLRDEWTAGRGGRAAWKAFHDEFLAHGAPPIPLVRQLMLGETAGPAW